MVHARIEQFLVALGSELDEIEKGKIDLGYLQSPEFFDLLIRGFDACVRSRSETRKRIAARFLKSVLTKPIERSRLDVDSVFDGLVDLSDAELDALRAIWILQKGFSIGQVDSSVSLVQLINRYEWDRLPTLLAGYSDDEIQYLLKRAERSGLVREATGAFLDYTGGYFYITDVFGRVMELIDDIPRV
jgi:hypothetical protein